MSPEIGDRIRVLRCSKHMTREQLAEKVEITGKFVYDIEMGKKGFSTQVLKGVAEALDVSCDYIVYGENSYQNIGDEISKLLMRMDKRQLEIAYNILANVCELCDPEGGDQEEAEERIQNELGLVNSDVKV